jgi:hypothetical protein
MPKYLKVPLWRMLRAQALAAEQHNSSLAEAAGTHIALYEGGAALGMR